MTIASDTGRPARVTCPSTRNPCSKTISAAASACPGPIVTVVEAEREPVRKSPAFALQRDEALGHPGQLEAAARRGARGGEVVLALRADVHAGELRVGEARDEAADERALGEHELDLLRVVAGHHGLGRRARLVAQRGRRACSAPG